MFFHKITLLTAAALMISFQANAADEEAAKALARQNNCFKCHSVEKEKDGPAWKKVAEKYRGKANAIHPSDHRREGQVRRWA